VSKSRANTDFVEVSSRSLIGKWHYPLLIAARPWQQSGAQVCISEHGGAEAYGPGQVEGYDGAQQTPQAVVARELSDRACVTVLRSRRRDGFVLDFGDSGLMQPPAAPPANRGRWTALRRGNQLAAQLN